MQIGCGHGCGQGKCYFKSTTQSSINIFRNKSNRWLFNSKFNTTFRFRSENCCFVVGTDNLLNQNHKHGSCIECVRSQNASIPRFLLILITMMWKLHPLKRIKFQCIASSFMGKSNLFVFSFISWFSRICNCIVNTLPMNNKYEIY